MFWPTFWPNRPTHLLQLATVVPHVKMLNSTGIRTCLATGDDASLKISPEGQITIRAFAPDYVYPVVYFAVQLTQSLLIVIRKTAQECLELIRSNSTDLSISMSSYFPENNLYHVPAPWDPVTVKFISGYEVNEFLNNTRRQTESTDYGVLKNYQAFQLEVYSTLVAFVILFAILLALHWVIFCEILTQRGNKRKLKSKMVSFRKILHSVINDRYKRTRISTLIFFVSCFLIATAFLSMFKTSQVATIRPKIITSYEQLFKSGARIFSSGEVFNLTRLIVPIEKDSKKIDIEHKFWNYFNSRKETVTLQEMQKGTYGQIAEKIASNEVVFVDADNMLDSLRALFCSFSESHQLFNMLIYKDPVQKEILHGYPMRWNFENPWIIRRLHRSVETHLPEHLLTMMIRYEGFNWKQTNPQHKSHQLQICTESTAAVEIPDLHSSGVDFFNFFFHLTLTAYFTCNICPCNWVHNFAPQKDSKEKDATHSSCSSCSSCSKCSGFYYLPSKTR